MKWFKHYSDNYRGRSVASFHRNFGHTGVSWYFLFTEICTEKLEKERGAGNAEASPTLSFDKVFVESALRGTYAKITRWLRHGVVLGLWTYKETEFDLNVRYPILLELLHTDLTKTRSRREHDKSVTRLELDKEEDKEEDKNILVVTTQKVSSPSRRQTIPFSEFKPSKEIQDNWINLYDYEYLKREWAKMSTYLIANAHKNKKTNRGWIQFAAGWLDRGWSNHQKSGHTKSDPFSLIQEEKNDVAVLSTANENSY